MAVYYTIGNLHTFSRSKLNAMQLVLLCKEKLISISNQEHLFEPLINDLKKLETVGIDIGLEESVKGTVVLITDDNLGQHWVGGFTTNFTSSPYVCRYCEIQGRDFLRHCDFSAPLRNGTSYDNYICMLQQRNENSLCGIKHASVFNKLAFYHVCQPGLPPCLAHDLFEGVVAYDVMLNLKDLMKKGWFSEEYLNSKINGFKFDTIVAASKALPIKKSSTKLSGNASQNWCFLRFLPLFVVYVLKDPNDPVWQLLLQLRLIVQLICAPAIKLEDISCMAFLIDDYVHARLTLFPQVMLRPKHHYMQHYPYLTYQFRPLIHLWTLRFEAKHSYFKRMLRFTGNFVNAAQTLATRHQMLNAYLLETGVFEPEMQCTYDSSTQYAPDVLNMLSMSCDTSKASVCKSVVYRGTHYTAGQYVVLSKRDLDVVAGKVMMLAQLENEVLLVVNMCLAHFVFALGVHELVPSGGDLSCIAISNLHDYYPLFPYNIVHGCSHLVLKHQIV